jgi:hypothetical protein
MAPAVDPAMMDRKGLGCFFFSPVCVVDAMIAVLPGYGLQAMWVLTGMGTFFLGVGRDGFRHFWYRRGAVVIYTCADVAVV